VIYTFLRLLPPLIALGLWAWVGDGTLLDPANLLLPLALLLAVMAWSSVRRYWHIRNTSRSRRDSSLLA
jgi:hypothetical protein